MSTIAQIAIQGGGTLAGSPYAYEENFIYASVPAADADMLRGATFEWKIGDRIVNTGFDNSYRPDDADIGKQITVTAVVPHASGAGSIRYTSGNAKTILGINDQPTGSLSFKVEPLGSGSKYIAVDLVQDEDGRGPMSYQWFVDGKAIAGANGSEFVLEQSAGQAVTLHGTYNDALGRATTVVSGAPAIRPDTPGALGIVGTVAPNGMLRAQLIDPDGIDTVHHAWAVQDTRGQWTAVPGAAGPEFAVGASAPAALRVQVDYVDGYGYAGQRATVLGTNGGDVIRTVGLGESVFAAGGNDTIHTSDNTHRIDGGAGLDTYVVDRAVHLIYQAADKPGEWHVESALAGGEGILTNVERVQLPNRWVALDIDGNAGQAFRLYKAAFDRPADDVGIGFWIHRLDNGTSLDAIANAFVSSAEFTTLYGANPTHAEIVAKFYANILDRTPDAGGVAFWNGVLDSGAATVAEVLVEFSESPENVAALVGSMQNGIDYLPYLIVID